MPATDTLSHFQNDLRLVDQQQCSGSHYRRTARAWLNSLDANDEAMCEALAGTYGDQAELWVLRWRMFFMCF